MKTFLIVYSFIVFAGLIQISLNLKEMVQELKLIKGAPLVSFILFSCLMALLLLVQIYAVWSFCHAKFPIWKKKFLKFKNKYIPYDIVLTLRIIWKKPISEE